MQGKDTLNTTTSFGSNIFLPNVFPYRTQLYGYEIGGGIRSKTALGSHHVSYEWRPNYFVELTGVYRKECTTAITPGNNTSIIYLGVRWNIQRREFDF
jgi:hypothetical protein